MIFFVLLTFLLIHVAGKVTNALESTTTDAKLMDEVPATLPSKVFPRIPLAGAFLNRYFPGATLSVSKAN